VTLSRRFGTANRQPRNVCLHVMALVQIRNKTEGRGVFPLNESNQL
jgi:hypothetical protein